MLSQKEKRLIKLKLQGKGDMEIAKETHYTYGTVRNYFSRIYKKLGCRSWFGIATKIYEEGEKNFFENN